MRFLTGALCCALMANYSVECIGHGDPIVVNVVDNRLTVSGGLVDEEGIVEWVFADDDDEAIFLPAPGNILLLNFPALEVHGMAAGDELWLEPIALPDYSQEVPADRSLWYWNPSVQAVTPLPSDHELEVLSSNVLGSSIQLGESEHFPATMLIDELNSTDIGQHRHLLTFLLPNSPLAPKGVYGFFTRLASPGFEDSEPFLIALNHGLDATSFQAGALAINLAALPPDEAPPGDFDADGMVDGHDFLLWQRSDSPDPLSPGDLTAWETNFGSTTLAVATAVPEPGSVGLLLMAAVAITISRPQRGCRSCTRNLAAEAARPDF